MCIKGGVTAELFDVTKTQNFHRWDMELQGKKRLQKKNLTFIQKSH